MLKAQLVQLLRQAVRHALATLTPAQRQVIELAYYGGLTRVDIATRLGEPVGIVKSRVRTALLNLRELLQDRPV